MIQALATASVSAILAVCEAFVLMLFWRQTSAYAAIGLVVPGISTVSVFASLRARETLSAAIKPPPMPTDITRPSDMNEIPQVSPDNQEGNGDIVLLVVSIYR